MTSLVWEVAAAVAFVGSHFLLSHPLRAPLVRRLGEGGFAGAYSVIAVVALAALGWAFWSAPVTAPLWPVGDGLWGLATVVMLLAAVLLMGSLIRNPALPTGGAPMAVPDQARASSPSRAIP